MPPTASSVLSPVTQQCPAARQARQRGAGGGVGEQAAEAEAWLRVLRADSGTVTPPLCTSVLHLFKGTKVSTLQG